MDDEQLMTEEIREAFFQEVLDLGQEVERYLLLLEEEPDNKEYIREVFRPFHTIKGNAGLSGELEIERLSQVAESVLDEVRQGRRPLTPPMMEGVLLATDLIRSIAENKSADAFGSQVDEMLQRLTELLKPPAEEEELPTGQPIINVVLRGQRAFTVSEADCRQAVIRIEQMDHFISRMKYEHCLEELVPAVAECATALRGVLQQQDSAGSPVRQLDYLITYLKVLEGSGQPYNADAWALIGMLSDDIQRTLYPQLVHCMKVTIHYLNPEDQIEDIRKQIEQANAAGAWGHMVNLNLESAPRRGEIAALIDLQRDFGPRLVLVQRSLGQKRLWREIGFFQEAAPRVRSTFWQGLSALAEAA